MSFLYINIYVICYRDDNSFACRDCVFSSASHPICNQTVITNKWLIYGRHFHQLIKDYWEQIKYFLNVLQWRHNGHNGVDQSRRSKKVSNLRVTGLCKGNPPVTSGLPSQRPVRWKMLPFDDVVVILLAVSVTIEWYIIINYITETKLHFNKNFVTVCAGSWQYNNHQCNQWRKFRKNDAISVSVVFIYWGVWY